MLSYLLSFILLSKAVAVRTTCRNCTRLAFVVGLTFLFISHLPNATRRTPSSRQPASIHYAEAVVVGIDFGDEFIKAIAMAPGRRFEIILSAQSERTMMNAVAFETEEQQLLLGPAAPSRAFDTEAEQYAKKRFKTSFMYANGYLGKCSDEDTCEGNGGIVGITSYQHFFPIEHIIDERRGMWKFGVSPNVKLSAEEIVAHILWYVKKRVIDTVGGDEEAVLSCTLTIPCHYTQRQRQSLMDAAEIASWNVLGLIHTPVSAAVALALDQPTTKAKKILVYSMGSGRVDAGVVNFEPIMKNGAPQSGNNTSVEGQSLELLSCASFENLGGHHLDFALAELAAEEFEKQNGISLREKPKALKLLLSKAIKVKHKLSASEDASFQVDSLYNGINFMMRVNRFDLEKLLTEMKYFEHLKSSIDVVLEKANISLSELDGFEIFGGVWRTPRIQELLSNIIQPLTLGKHLNSNEAAARGAAFIAANRSSTFRTRYPIRAKDIIVQPLGVHIESLEQPGDSTKEEPISKEATLLQPTSKLNNNVKISIQTSGNLKFTLYEGEQKKPIAFYTITGIREAVEGKYKNFGKPRIYLLFQSNASGVVHCQEAIAIFEETVLEKVAKNGSSKSDTKLSGNVTVKTPTGNKENELNSTSEEVNVLQNTTVNASSNDNEGVTATGPSGNTESYDDAKNSSAVKQKKETNVDESTVNQELMKERIVKHRVTLEVTSIAAVPLPLGHEQKKDASKLLAEYNAKDKKADMLSQERNDLESYIYSARALLKTPLYEKVVSPENMSNLITAFANGEDWLYENVHADYAAVSSKLQELQNDFEPFVFNAKEAEVRPKVILKMNKFLNDEFEKLMKLISKSPWIAKNLTDNAITFFESLKNWWGTAVKKQEEMQSHEPPVFTQVEVEAKMKEQRLIRTKLEKIPSPTTTTTTSSTTTEATAQTNETESSTVPPSESSSTATQNTDDTSSKNESETKGNSGEL